MNLKYSRIARLESMPPKGREGVLLEAEPFVFVPLSTSPVAAQ